ncbi:MAG: hypothetical protein IJ740_03530 [Ruminococcus sp.]|nr:hypothetical protein [Ruminococcus sp.]
MKFEEALKAMREGKKANKKGSDEYYFIKDNVLYYEDGEGEVRNLNEGCCSFSIEAVFSEDWEIANNAPKSDHITETNKIDIKITFIGGGEIVIPDEQWDDYRYDGKFFTIIKEGVDIAMYNAKNVYSLVLVRQGD